MKIIPWILVVALGAIIIFFWQDSKGLDEENERLKQTIEGRDITIKEKGDEYLKLKKDMDSKIYELNSQIDSANTVIANKDEEIATQDGKLNDLREAQKSITNKDDLIENLKKQIFLLDKKFLLAQEQLREKDKIIFSLTEKYELEHELRLAAEELCDEMARQIADQKQFITNLTRRLAQQRRASFWHKSGIGAAFFLLGLVIGK